MGPTGALPAVDVDTAGRATIDDERAPADVEPARRGARFAPIAPFAALWAAISVVGLIVLDRRGRSTVFFFDEWQWLLERRTPGASSLLEAHNGHLSILPVAAYQLMIAVVGLDHYHPYRLLGLLVHLAVATLVAVLLRRRRSTVEGLAGGAIVLLLGAGWQNIFWPFQIGMMGSVAFGLAAWLALDRPGRRGAITGSALLAGALGCSGVGIPFAAAVIVRLLAERTRRILYLVPTLVVYGVWYLAYGEPQGGAENLDQAPDYVEQAASGSFAALAGRTLDAGKVGVLLLAAWVVMRCVSTRRLSPALLGALSLPLVTWLLQVYARGEIADPVASRYVYNGAVMLLVVVAETPTIERTLVADRWWQAIVVTGATLAIWGNWWILNAGVGGLRETADYVRAELRMVEWAQSSVAPEFVADAPRMTPHVRADRYLAAVEEAGSPAYPDEQVAGRPPLVRAAADGVSIAALGDHPRPGVGPGGAGRMRCRGPARRARRRGRDDDRAARSSAAEPGSGPTRRRRRRRAARHPRRGCDVDRAGRSRPVDVASGRARRGPDRGLQRFSLLSAAQSGRYARRPCTAAA